MLKLIGQAKVVGSLPAHFSGKAHIVKTQGIRAGDIVLRFLRSEKLESTAFLAFYYLLKQEHLPLSKAAEIIGDEHSTLQSKGKLLDCIQDVSSLRIPLPSISTASGQRKMKIRDTLRRKELSLNPDLSAGGENGLGCPFLEKVSGE